jgi:hypothetical protein
MIAGKGVKTGNEETEKVAGEICSSIGILFFFPCIRSRTYRLPGKKNKAKRLKSR